jgi:selenocysteine lyase/cysteine desulfurase
MVAYSLGASFGPGDRVLTSQAEYASNVIGLLQLAARTGASVEVVPDDESGQLDVDALERMLDERVRLVTMSWIPTQGGLVNPAAAVGAVTRAAGVPYLLDACQAVGQLPIDVDALGCDFLSATGRKYLRAPRGTGLLYVRRDWIERLDPPFLDVHAARWTEGDGVVARADARRVESWERSVANQLGLGTAAEYALALGVEAIRVRVVELASSLRDQLAAIPGLTLHDRGVERCGIVTFTVADVDVYELAASLRVQGINISVSTIDFARYDFEARGLTAINRASVHYYNTDDELTRLVHAVATAARA